MQEQLFKQAKALSPSGIHEPEFIPVEIAGQVYEMNFYVLGHVITFNLKPRGSQFTRRAIDVTKTTVVEVSVGSVPEQDKVFNERPLLESLEELMQLYLAAIEKKLAED